MDVVLQNTRAADGPRAAVDLPAVDLPTVDWRAVHVECPDEGRDRVLEALSLVLVAGVAACFLPASFCPQGSNESAHELEGLAHLAKLPGFQTVTIIFSLAVVAFAFVHHFGSPLVIARNWVCAIEHSFRSRLDIARTSVWAYLRRRFTTPDITPQMDPTSGMPGAYPGVVVVPAPSETEGIHVDPGIVFAPDSTSEQPFC